MPRPLWKEVEILEHTCKYWKLMQNQLFFKSVGDDFFKLLRRKIQYVNCIPLIPSKSRGIRTVNSLWLINSNKCNEIE